MTETIDILNQHRRAIDLIKEVAMEKACRPFLVGGPVRDLLLGRQGLDVDLTLENGGSVLARALAKRVNGRLRSYPQFLTYKVTAEGLPEIDIATARKERYRTPGALPAVEPGKLKDDLLRRDFSINAIAMDLLDRTLHDPTGGEPDLRARIVRVLHDRSFIDDPTRIFRAIRLAKRLGFEIEAHTSTLIDEAVAGGAFDSVSRERLWRELFLAMDEEEAPQVLTALDERGVTTHLLGTRTDPESGAMLERVRQELATRPGLDRYVLYSGALLQNLNVDAAQLEGSGFSQKRARSVLQIARDLDRFERSLTGANSERQRFRLLKSVSPEMRSLLASERPQESIHVARFEEFQKFKLPLRGNELEMPGGPHVAKALERTREAVFTGEIPAEQARTFAREMAMKYLDRERLSDSK